jgi:hypothetical protein
MPRLLQPLPQQGQQQGQQQQQPREPAVQLQLVSQKAVQLLQGPLGSCALLCMTAVPWQQRA